MLLASKLGALSVLLSDIGERAADGFSQSAAGLLLTLRFRSLLTATELADIVGIAQPTAVRVLDGLVRRGLVVRQKRAGRAAPVRLTSLGRRRAERLLSARLEAIGYVVATLSRNEHAELERIIDKLLAAAATSRSFARTTCRLCDHAACDGPRCPIGTRATELEREAEIASRGGRAC
ncbi:MAG TPA: MarR family transcriptional regulator [Stellaceae bacterium]|nr:MarR family transcriptional regulator [Stellaceae bacterium]